MTTMRGNWRGVLWMSALAAVIPPILGAGGLAAAPLLTAVDAEQSAPAAPHGAPAPRTAPAPPRPGRGPASEEWSRERQARRDAERVWVDAEAIVRQFKGGEGITLDLLNMLGDVVVVGGKGREGRLSIVRRVQGRGVDAEALLKTFEIDVAEHGNRVAVRSTLPVTPTQPPTRGSRTRVRTDYEIALPAGTALELKNMQGNVRVTNVGGDVRVEAMAGDVVAEALSRVRMLRSLSGDVMLSRSVVSGDANLQSVSGNVIASGVTATSLTMGTVSGNVEVRESSSARALVRTVSGNIEFASAPRQSGRYELRTHAGDIVVFASGGGFEFEANTFKGAVTSDIPTQPGPPGSRQVRGTSGDGSAFFDLTTFTGDIRVASKPPRDR